MPRKSPRRDGVAFLLVLLGAGGCMVSVGERVPADGAVPAPARDEAAVAVADAVLAQVNEARRDAGVGPLAPSDALNRAASEYAAELVRRRRLNHRSPTPGRETMTDRIDAVGVPWSAAAENLAARSGPAARVASYVVDGWLGSAGHRRNLLNGDYTLAGTGAAVDARGVWYVVQLYVRPRETRR